MGTLKNSRNPWAWIPTLYFAEGLPNVIVTALSVVMYMQLGLTDAEVGLYTGWLALPWVIIGSRGCDEAGVAPGSLAGAGFLLVDMREAVLEVIPNRAI